MENKDKIILHLCASEFGSDSKPYRDAGYDVRLIDKKIGVENYHPPKGVYGIIANPPCTMFSIARQRARTPRNLREGMRLVKECQRVIWEALYDDFEALTPRLKFWVIENPATGLLKYFLGKPTFQYSPDEFGDDWRKRTALWGYFTPPMKNLLHVQLRSGKSVDDIHTPMTERDREKRTDLRSIASPYFTRAFFEVNQ